MPKIPIRLRVFQAEIIRSTHRVRVCPKTPVTTPWRGSCQRQTRHKAGNLVLATRNAWSRVNQVVKKIRFLAT
jgi:hypothetical protein